MKYLKLYEEYVEKEESYTPEYSKEEEKQQEKEKPKKKKITGSVQPIKKCIG